MDNQRTQRQLEHLTLLLQKSGHALAGYLADPAAGEVAPELLLLVPDDDLTNLGRIMAEVAGAHLQLTQGTAPDTFYLLTASGQPGPRLRAFPASATTDYAKTATSRRGRVLFDHPGVFTRR